MINGSLRRVVYGRILNLALSIMWGFGVARIWMTMVFRMGLFNVGWCQIMMQITLLVQGHAAIVWIL